MAYAAPGPAPAFGEAAHRVNTGDRLMPFSDARERKSRSRAVVRAIERRTNPWYVVCALVVVVMWLARYSRREVVSKRHVRRHRDGLDGDLREALARIGQSENDLFEARKSRERYVRENDSLRAELETVRHEAETWKLEAEKAKKTSDSELGCEKQLKEAKLEAEHARHEKKGCELELERAKHEAQFTREHIKEEVIKEETEALEKRIVEDEKAEASQLDAESPIKSKTDEPKEVNTSSAGTGASARRL